MPRFDRIDVVDRVPPISMSPAEISSRPAIIRSRVDLPQPEGPTKTTNSLRLDVEVDALDHLERAERFSDTA